MRAWDHLRHRQGEFDIVQDNQCLGFGLLLIERQLGIPVLGTIHHPITVDRRLEIEAAESWYKKLTLRRWYSFVDMQTEVARRLKRIITVSENSFKDIVADHKVDPERMAVVPVGVDVDLFKPVAGRAAGPGSPRHHRVGRRRHEGPQVPARGAWPSSAPSATTSTSW